MGSSLFFFLIEMWGNQTWMKVSKTGINSQSLWWVLWCVSPSGPPGPNLMLSWCWLLIGPGWVLPESCHHKITALPEVIAQGQPTSNKASIRQWYKRLAILPYFGTTLKGLPSSRALFEDELMPLLQCVSVQYVHLPTHASFSPSKVPIPKAPQ